MVGTNHEQIINLNGTRCPCSTWEILATVKRRINLEIFKNLQQKKDLMQMNQLFPKVKNNYASW
jgi:hypothetical protein